MVAAGAPADAVQMNKTRSLVMLGAALVAAAAMLAYAGTRSEQASAQSGPCGTANDYVDASEASLAQQLNSWRAGQGKTTMELSGPANRAAQWFAEAVAAGNTSEHLDQHGRDWHERLIDCGFPGRFASGETLAAAASASAAYNSMTAEPHGDAAVEVSNWTCLGVGNAGGAWVVVVAFRFEEGCPEPGPGTPPTTTGGTTTTTTAPTNTPTKTATPTATPDANYGETIEVCGGWNLVTIPVTGDVDDVFDTAEVDIAAIYKPNGETWLRWAPGVPAYARNLSHVSTGDVLWIYRPEPSCVDIDV